jgi:hypothetical protein
MKVILFIFLAFSPVLGQAAEDWSAFAETDTEVYFIDLAERSTTGPVTAAWVRVRDTTDSTLLKQVRYEARCVALTLRLTDRITYFSYARPIGEPPRRIQLSQPESYRPERPKYFSPAPGTVGRKLLAVLCTFRE